MPRLTFFAFVTAILLSRPLAPPAAWGDDGSTQEPAPIIISTLDIEGLIGTPADARYNRLLNAVADDLGVPVDVRTVPGRRLERQFNILGKGCLFPEYRAPERSDIIRSAPFNQATVHIVTLATVGRSQPPRSIAGLRVGIVSGYMYDFVDLSQASAVSSVESEAQNMQLLRFGRVDAILSYFPDLPLAVKDYEMAALAYDPAHRLFVYPERFACFDTPQNRAFLDGFATTVEKLHKSGELSDMLAPYFYGLPDETAGKGEGDAVLGQ